MGIWEPGFPEASHSSHTDESSSLHLNCACFPSECPEVGKPWVPSQCALGGQHPGAVTARCSGLGTPVVLPGEDSGSLYLVSSELRPMPLSFADCVFPE